MQSGISPKLAKTNCIGIKLYDLVFVLVFLGGEWKDGER